MNGNTARKWVPDGVHNNASAGVSKLKPAPQSESLFDEDGQSVPKQAPKKSGGVDLAHKRAEQWWLKQALEAISMTKLWSQPWEPYDLEQHFGLSPDHGNRWGALIRRAVKAGLIVHQGYKYTERPSANSREVRTYRSASNPWVRP